MNAEERRKNVLKALTASDKPISGNELAGMLNVSRQVIVQDIAILRAENNNILSTSNGYTMPQKNVHKRVIKCLHTDNEAEEELNMIVDLGGRIDDVFVNHKVYGEVHAELSIKSRKDVSAFINTINLGLSKPLKNITGGYHYHTIEADSEEELDLIEEKLRERKFIVDKRY